MYTLGPFTMTAGTPVGPLQLGKDIGALQIHNDSPFNVYVSPQQAAPSATDSLNGGYNGVATPYSHPVIRLQPRSGSLAEQATNAIAAFGGVLYLMPVDPQAALARAGTVSSLAQVHVDVYSQWETPPEAWANPRQMDVTSQPRVIAIPSVPDIFLQGNFGGALAAGATKYDGSVFPTYNSPNGYTFTFFLYSLDLYPWGGTYDCEVFFVCDLRTAGGGGGSLVQSIVLYHGWAMNNGTSNTRNGTHYAPSAPALVSWSGGSSNNLIPTFGFKNNSGTAVGGASYDAALVFQATDQSVNWAEPAPLGGYAHQGNGSVTTGFTY